ncbi:MAG: ABC transporter permease [Planctomycetota bacterium]|nr:ABC transporter permease [Planctomycetota bacterium]
MRSSRVLVRKHLLQHWVRSGLTVAAITLAMFLLCSVISIVTTLDRAVNSEATQRLVVQSAVSLFVNLPLGYQEKIVAVPGVEDVTVFQWFGGYFKEDEQPFAQFAVDHENFLHMYAKDMRVAEGPRGVTGDSALEAVQAAMNADRRAAIIGPDLARENNWKVGDTVPIIAKIFTKQDRSAWEFDIVGIYEPLKSNFDPRQMFFRFDYLRETLEAEGMVDDMGTGVYMVNLEATADPGLVSQAIDGLFENGPQRTKTATEAVFQSFFIAMLGNVPAFMGAIGGAIVFAVLFSVVNTMLMAGRQRRGEAGILKALGFSNACVARLLLYESLVLCLTGGALGIGIAALFEEPVRWAVGGALPGYTVEPSTLLLAVGVTLVVGVVAGIGPALGLGRLQPADALRSEA